jgi:hypothetical protein
MRIQLYIVLLAIALIAVACIPLAVSDVTKAPDNYLDQKITVSGTVQNTVKLGDLSGYTLQDPAQSDAVIKVSAKRLPAEGDKITVKGLWTHDSLFGYYLKAEE